MTSPELPTVRLDVLGIARVSAISDVSARPLLTAPRRLAVFMYLALARPRGLHSRDTVLAMLWPEAPQASGRHALRNALHAIRKALGGAIIVTSGDGLVGVDATRIECDALLLESDLAEGRTDEAVSRYQGELLQGFVVANAPEFARWRDSERRRLRDAVLDAAWSRAEACRAKGDVTGALRLARRASELAPDDELSLRRLLTMLSDGGDRAAATRAYAQFADRFKRGYETEFSAETQALAHTLRLVPSGEVPLAALPAPRVVLPHSEDAQRELPAPTEDIGHAYAGAARPILTSKWLWAVAVILLVLIAAVLVIGSRPSVANVVVRGERATAFANLRDHSRSLPDQLQ